MNKAMGRQGLRRGQDQTLSAPRVLCASVLASSCSSSARSVRRHRTATPRLSLVGRMEEQRQCEGCADRGDERNEPQASEVDDVAVVERRADEDWTERVCDQRTEAEDLQV